MIKPLTPEERDAMEAESHRREALYATARASECAQCGSRMAVALQGGELVLRCMVDASHRGYGRQKTLTELHDDGYIISYVSEAIERKRRRKLEETIGTDGARQALVATPPGERYLITPEAARRAIHTLWPKAGWDAKLRVELTCAQHNLNPLDKDIFIGTMNEGKPNQTDVVLLGIPGNRKIARRKSHYRVVDGPRAMTKEEVEAIREDYDKKLWCIMVLELPDGNRVTGYGAFPMNATFLGEDKGNTRFNMCCIRAERNALARIVPPEDLPAPLAMEVEGVFYDIGEIDNAVPLTDRPALSAAEARPISRPPSAPPTPSTPTESPPSDPEHEKLRGYLADAGFLTPDHRLRNDKAEELRKLLSDHGTTKLSELQGEQLTRFTNKLLDLAIVRMDGQEEKRGQSQPATTP